MNPVHMVFLDRDTFPADIQLPAALAAHDLQCYGSTAADQVLSRLQGADIAILNKIKMPAEILRELPKLRMIALAATGTDNIDLDTCNRMGIIVSNVRGYAINTVPEHTFALILALRRNLLNYRDSVRSGRWHASGQFCYFDYPISDLAGATLGIIGRGALGEAVAQIARAFGMRVQFAARKESNAPAEDYTSFNHFLRSSDIISLHCPLNDQTRGMIGATEFALMEKKPLLINTSRGGLVDERALGHALRSGQISGAGFDVATQEPPAPDHPLMELTQLPNFLLTPHVAWASAQAMQAVLRQVSDNIEAFLKDAPRNVVAGFSG